MVEAPGEGGPLSEIKLIQVILLYGRIKHLKGLEVDLVPQDSSHSTKSSAELGSLLGLVSDDLKSGT